MLPSQYSNLLNFTSAKESPSVRSQNSSDQFSEIDLDAPSRSNSGINSTTDRYGFLLTDKLHQSLPLTDDERRERKRIALSREKKWLVMIKDWDKYLNPVTRAVDGKFKSRIRKGIPDELRCSVWNKLIDSSAIRQQHPEYLKINISGLAATIIDEIDRDVRRTYPRHVQFEDSDGQGQHSLRRLLQVYASLDPEIGYVQGMGYIAGMLLMYMPEDTAFYCFYSIMQRPKCPLRTLYLPNLPETQKMLFIFIGIGHELIPEIWNHLKSVGMHPSMYFTEWIMTMFCRGFSFDLVTRVWDIFLSEGSFKIVNRVSLAILKYFEKSILSGTLDDITSLMNDMPRRMDAEVVMQIAWTIPLKTVHIENHEKFYAQWQRRNRSSDPSGGGVPITQPVEMV